MRMGPIQRTSNFVCFTCCRAFESHVHQRGIASQFPAIAQSGYTGNLPAGRKQSMPTTRSPATLLSVVLNCFSQIMPTLDPPKKNEGENNMNSSREHLCGSLEQR